MSRASDFSEEIGTEIAALVAQGMSLKQVAEQAEGEWPSLRTMLRWSSQHESFARMLAFARIDKASSLMDESIAISDESVADVAQAARNRVRVQARQYMAARLDPARWAEKIGVAVGFSGPAKHDEKSVEDMGQNEMARRVAFAWHLGVKEMEAENPNMRDIERFLDFAALLKQGLDAVKRRKQGPPPQLTFVEQSNDTPSPDKQH